jgi:hypothetical protein
MKFFIDNKVKPITMALSKNDACYDLTIGGPKNSNFK